MVIEHCFLVFRPRLISQRPRPASGLASLDPAPAPARLHALQGPKATAPRLARAFIGPRVTRTAGAHLHFPPIAFYISSLAPGLANRFRRVISKRWITDAPI